MAAQESSLRRAIGAVAVAGMSLAITLAACKLMGLGEVDDLPWSLILLPLVGFTVGVFLLVALVMAVIGMMALMILIDDHRADKARKGDAVA